MDDILDLGLGFKNDYGIYNNQSIESHDGDCDSYGCEAAIARNFIETCETYERINQMNIAYKLSMINSLQSKYGKKSAKLSRALKAMSLEDGEPEAQNTDEQSQNNEETKDKIENKKPGFFSKILAGIKKFFSGIWSFIKTIFSKIRSFFSKAKTGQSDENGLIRRLEYVIGTAHKAIEHVDPVKNEFDNSITELEKKLNSANNISEINSIKVKTFVAISKIFMTTFTIMGDVYSAINKSVGMLSKLKQKKLAGLSKTLAARKTDEDITQKLQSTSSEFEISLKSGIELSKKISEVLIDKNTDIKENSNGANAEFTMHIVKFIEGCGKLIGNMFELVNINGNEYRDYKPEEIKGIINKIKAHFDKNKAERENMEFYQHGCKYIEELAKQVKTQLKYDKSEEMFNMMSRILEIPVDKIKEVYNMDDKVLEDEDRRKKENKSADKEIESLNKQIQDIKSNNDMSKDDKKEKIEELNKKIEELKKKQKNNNEEINKKPEWEEDDND